jgi:hypothetical protein
VERGSLLIALKIVDLKKFVSCHHKPKNFFPTMRIFVLPMVTLLLLLSPLNRVRSQSLPFPDNSTQSKSVQENSEKPDSTMTDLWDVGASSWHGFRREVYTYDPAGNRILSMRYIRYTLTDPWIIDIKFENAYDIAGNPTMKQQSIWDENLHRWRNEEKYEDSWNENRKLTRETFYQKDTATGEWISVNRSDYAYDANNNRTEYIYYYWDLTAGQFLPAIRIDYTCDANGNDTLATAYGWHPDISQWVLTNKSEFAWDANNNLSSETDKYLDNDTWYTDILQEYAYNEAGQKIQFTFTGYSKETHTPYSGTRTYYSYDAAGNMILSGTDNLDISSGLWKNQSKYEVSYDAAGRDTMNSLYSWDNDKSDWTGIQKNETSYDENGNITLTVQSDWDANANNWKFSSRQKYYYSVHSLTPVDQVREKSVRIYPNPASDDVVFDGNGINGYTTVELFDMNGRKVMQVQLSENRTVSVRNLPDGLYLYHIHSGNAFLQGKLVKK